MSASPLFVPLTLPNGLVVPNRIAKAAMEENLADRAHLPGQALLRLYSRWAEGGAGLILTGNVMIDARALTGPGGVVLDDAQPLAPFAAWARAIGAGGGLAWMQINHPGRQVYAAMRQETVAPSAVSLRMGRFSSLFPPPRALTGEEIADIVARFALTASRAEQAGFAGVQIHAAHGYLLSQFLSPLSNLRTDAWGGSLENRARLLLDVVRAVRAKVSPGFGVGVKLNSADFQRGGFAHQDALQIVRWLGALPVDLVELSGGSYESPAMTGKATSSTIAREAYFVDFAREIAAEASMPIMVTGGIRRRAVAEAALVPSDGRTAIALVGIARALAYAPDLPNHWRTGERDVALPSVGWSSPALSSVAQMAMTKTQLGRMGKGRQPQTRPRPVLAMLSQQIGDARHTRAYRRWIVRHRKAAGATS
jgi:2,4-dienoyl-CoA reductase-like NADH-dependent reductase (Old Yellow Enzyme family)